MRIISIILVIISIFAINSFQLLADENIESIQKKAEAGDIRKQFKQLVLCPKER